MSRCFQYPTVLRLRLVPGAAGGALLARAWGLTEKAESVLERGRFRSAGAIREEPGLLFETGSTTANRLALHGAIVTTRDSLSGGVVQE